MILHRCFLFASVLLATGLYAQAPKKSGEPPPTRRLSVCFLFAPSATELFYKDIHDAYQPLVMGTTRFGSWCDIPAISPLPIYRRGYERERVVIDPKTKERVVIPSKTTYAQIDAWELPTGLDPVRKLYYFDARGAVAQRVFTDTLGSHGARQARVFNLLAHSGGVRFGATRKVLPPGTEALIDIGAEPDTIFGFQFGIENGAESYISPEKNLRLRGDRQRLTVVLAYRPVVEGTKQNEYSSEETQAGKITYVPEALRIYENVDRPPSAANTGNRVVSR